MIHLIVREPIAYQRTLCQHLSDYYQGDFAAWFVTGNESDLAESDTFQRYFLPEAGFTKLFSLLRTDKAPVVVLGGWSSAFAYKVLSVTTTLRVPTFIWADHPHPRKRSFLFERSRRIYLSSLSRKVSGFLACGSPTVGYLAALGISTDRIFNFPYWAKVPSVWTIPSGCDEARRSEPLKLLAIGRLVAAKGFDVAIAAVARANRNAGRTIAELLIVGDGPERASLERQVKADVLAAPTSFAGQLENDDVVEKLKNADALIVPSQFEPYGVVVLEALAQGRPVLSSDQVIAAIDKDDGSQAILFHEAGNIEQLANQIEELTQDRTALESMSRAARAIAENSKPETAGPALQRIFEARLQQRRKSSRYSTLAETKAEPTPHA